MDRYIYHALRFLMNGLRMMSESSTRSGGPAEALKRWSSSGPDAPVSQTDGSLDLRRLRTSSPNSWRLTAPDLVPLSYAVGEDRRVTVDIPLITGQELTGSLAGQTFTIANLSSMMERRRYW
jgi:hypothetical protein